MPHFMSDVALVAGVVLLLVVLSALLSPFETLARPRRPAGRALSATL